MSAPQGTWPDFRALFESAPGLYLVLTPGLTIVAVSNAYLQATMTHREDILGRGLFEVFPDNPDDPAATGTRNLKASLERVLAGRAADTMAVQKYDIRRPESEGGGFEERYWSPVNSPVLNPAGQIDYIIHRVEDVTEFVRLSALRSEQQRLVEASDLLRNVVESSDAAIITKTLTGIITTWNPAAMRIFGYSAQEAVGQPMLMLIPPEQTDEELAILSRVARGEIVDHFETVRLRKGGARIEISATISPIKDTTGRVIGASKIARDITEQRRFAVRQAQQARLGALGQMASGIAHDINNALSPVSLYTESMLEREGHLSAEGRRHLETIQRAIEDVALTVARLREFYRPREPEMQLAPVNLNSLIPQVLELTRARWSDMAHQHGISIDVHTDLPPGLPLIMGADSEIRDALTNLIFNAVDALPEGGALTIRAVESGQSVRVEVIDTGVGMDEETRRRCLEPFFTTKGERGTGLGLAMVYGVMRRHSGEIELESALGQGTTVRLCFRASTAVTVSATQSVPAALPSALRILIVDDDPVLLQSLSEILKDDGHDVTVAAGGEAGIEAFRATQTFDVVITDLGMPHVDGRKVASAIKSLSPATPVILLTGWGQRLVAEGQIPAHVDRVLSKPPKLRDVRMALVELTQRLLS